MGELLTLTGWQEERLVQVLVILEAAGVIVRQRQKDLHNEWHTCVRWVV